jgi:hypothetical protein
MTGPPLREHDRASRWQWLLMSSAVVILSRPYLAGRSLWHDEAALALNVLEQPFTGLLGPLAYTQAAPVGFLLLTKLVVLLLGASEYALRLVPFTAAVASIGLFYAVAKRILPAPGATAALALLALASPLVNYGCQLKPYAVDACIMLGLLLHFSTRPAPGHLRGAVRLAVLGAGAVWLSYPSVFVLAGLGTPLLLQSLCGRDWKRVALLGGAYGFWVANAAWLYLVSERWMATDPHVVRYWSAGFMPLPPWSLEQLRWFSRTLGGTLQNVAGLRPPPVAAMLVGVGFFVLLRDNRRTWWNLSLPALVTLLASGLRLYPFKGRTIFFLAPLLYLLAGAGFAFFWQRGERVLGALLLAVLLVPAGIRKGEGLFRSDRESAVPAVLAYARDHWRDGDFIYVYSGAEYTFRYYSGRFGFTPEQFRIGISERKVPAKLLEELEDLRGHRRLWLVFAHVWRSERFSGEQWFLHHLNRWGKLEHRLRFQNASLYLFSLRPAA